MPSFLKSFQESHPGDLVTFYCPQIGHMPLPTCNEPARSNLVRMLLPLANIVWNFASKKAGNMDIAQGINGSFHRVPESYF